MRQTTTASSFHWFSQRWRETENNASQNWSSVFPAPFSASLLSPCQPFFSLRLQRLPPFKPSPRIKIRKVLMFIIYIWLNLIFIYMLAIQAVSIFKCHLNFPRSDPSTYKDKLSHLFLDLTWYIHYTPPQSKPHLSSSVKSFKVFRMLRNKSVYVLLSGLPVLALPPK